MYQVPAVIRLSSFWLWMIPCRLGLILLLLVFVFVSLVQKLFAYVVFGFNVFILKLVKVISKFSMSEHKLPAFNIQPFNQVAQIFHTLLWYFMHDLLGAKIATKRDINNNITFNLINIM
jgi:hypothetical protein